MRVVSWNVNHCMRSADARQRAWKYLTEELRPDVAFLQEFVPPPGIEAVYRPIDEKDSRYNWGSAVVALSPKYQLQERTRRPVNSPHALGEIPESHPGTTAIADVVDVATGAVIFVAVSFYVRWDYLWPDKDSIYAASSAHRILSDLSPLLMWSTRTPHKTPVLVAGDFNITSQVASAKSWQVEFEEARVFFDRVSALGLRDLFAATTSGAERPFACSCPRPDECTHVQTYRFGNRTDSRPTQLDYAFASDALTQRITACRACDDDAAWALSDHCPLVLEFADTAT